MVVGGAISAPRGRGAQRIWAPSTADLGPWTLLVGALTPYGALRRKNAGHEGRTAARENEIMMNTVQHVYLRSRVGLRRLSERMSGDERGVVAAEYVAILVLVAAVVAAIIALDIPGQVSGHVGDALSDLFDGGAGGTSGGTRDGVQAQ